jgi:hypothetical protein
MLLADVSQDRSLGSLRAFDNDKSSQCQISEQNSQARAVKGKGDKGKGDKGKGDKGKDEETRDEETVKESEFQASDTSKLHAC